MKKNCRDCIPVRYKSDWLRTKNTKPNNVRQKNPDKNRKKPNKPNNQTTKQPNNQTTKQTNHSLNTNQFKVNPTKYHHLLT